MTTPTQMWLKYILAFLHLNEHAKKSVYYIHSFFHSWNKANFMVQWPEWLNPYSTMTYQKHFNQLLVFMNLHPHANNQAISSFCSKDIVHLKILQSNVPRAFRTISQGPDLFQIWDRKVVNNINTHCRTNSEKFSE